MTWKSDDESDEEGPAGLNAPPPLQNRFQRVVVLKGMFDLKDLEKEPELLLDLKEDVREEAESLGQVTSLVLYDVSLLSPARQCIADPRTERGGRRHHHQVQGCPRRPGLRSEDEWTVLRWSKSEFK